MVHSWVVRLNAAFKVHFVGVLLFGVVLGAGFPSLGLALKDTTFFRIPGTGWSYDFPNLALGLMMLSAIMGCEIRDFKKVARRPRPAVLSLIVIYGVIPAIAAVTGLLWVRLTGEENVQILVGLMLSALMPVAMTSALWVRLSAGNVPLLLSLITVTTGLSVASVPVYLRALLGVSGAGVEVPTDSIIQQLVISVTAPLVLGLSLRHVLPKVVTKLQDGVTMFANLALWLVVVANVAVAAPHVRNDAKGFVAAVVLAVMLNAISYGVGLFAARAMHLSHEDSLTLIFGSGMRSNSTGLMLGLKGFPTMPLVSVPAAVYMISQHLMAAFIARKLDRPGSRLLGTTVAVERRSLEAYLGRALPERHATGFALVVMHLFRDGGIAPKELERITRLMRRRVRDSDFVCILGEDSFGLVLTQASQQGVPIVLDRLTRAAFSYEPNIKLTHGAVHSLEGVPTPQQLIELASKQSELDASRAGLGSIRLVS